MRYHVLTVLSGLFILLALTELGLCVFRVMDYRTAVQSYEELSETYTVTDFDTENDREKSPIRTDFEALAQENPDIAGWLYCPDTVIDYPLVQGTDNEFYLHHLLSGEYSFGGTLFMDAGCAKDFSCRNTIVYGHFMNDGSMFASLAGYKYEGNGYLEAHPVLYLNSPGQNYRVEIFACRTVADGSDAYQTSFDSTEDFLRWITDMRNNSYISAPDVEIRETDRVVTLSTCSYEYEDARMVTVGVLRPIG